MNYRNRTVTYDDSTMRFIVADETVSVEFECILAGKKVNKRWRFMKSTGKLFNDPKFPLTLEELSSPMGCYTAKNHLSKQFEMVFGKPESHQHLRLIK